MNLINPLFDFFIPRFCLFCKIKLLPDEELICPDCKSTINLASSERLSSEYQRKFVSDNLIEDSASAFVFEKDGVLQTLIHELKYEKKFRIGIFLGKISSHYFVDKINLWNCDYIIPVPLHPKKLAERGYNQSYFIAKGIGNNLRIKSLDKAMKRIKFTQTQTNLTLRERKKNVEGAFAVRKRFDPENKKVILVDDVITTGATISECAKVLKDKGAAKVYAASVAIAD